MLDFIDQVPPGRFPLPARGLGVQIQKDAKTLEMYRVRIAHPRVSCLSILPSLYDRMKPYPQLFFFKIHCPIVIFELVAMHVFWSRGCDRYVVHDIPWVELHDI